MNTKTLIAVALAAAAALPAFAHNGVRACPPGLAKKHNGCLPPGQAKKVYRDAVVGHHVPANAEYAIPRQVRAQLPRQPAGFRYAVVNNQVVLVSSANIVVDIIRSMPG